MAQPFLLETPSSSASTTPTTPGFFLPLCPFSSDSKGAVSVSYHSHVLLSLPPCCCHQLQIHISSDLLSSDGGTNVHLGGALAAHTGVPSGVFPSAFPLTFQRPKLKPLSASHLATSSPPGFLWPALFWVSLPPTHLQALWPTQRGPPCTSPASPLLILGRLPRWADTCLWGGCGICILPLLSHLYESRPPDSSQHTPCISELEVFAQAVGSLQDPSHYSVQLPGLSSVSLSEI